MIWKERGWKWLGLFWDRPRGPAIFLCRNCEAESKFSAPVCHDLISEREGWQALPKHWYHLLTARRRTPKDKIYKSLSVRRGIFCFYTILSFLKVLSDPHSSTHMWTVFIFIKFQFHDTLCAFTFGKVLRPATSTQVLLGFPVSV